MRNIQNIKSCYVDNILNINRSISVIDADFDIHTVTEKRGGVWFKYKSYK